MIIRAEQLKPQLTIEQIERFLEPLILKANEDGLKSIRTYGPSNVFGDTALYSSRNYPEIVQKTLDMLRLAGYEAKIVAEEKQFVDIYLYISWA